MVKKTILTSIICLIISMCVFSSNAQEIVNKANTSEVISSSHLHNSTTNSSLQHEIIIDKDSFCDGKLHHQDNILNPTEINSLCQLLTENPNFIVRIRNARDAYLISKILLQGSSAKFFFRKCHSFPNFCQFGFLIDVYVDDIIIIVQPGSKVKKSVSDGYRNRVIESIRFNLERQEWFTSLEKTIKLLNHKLKGGATTINASQSGKPEDFEWYILYPTLIITFISITTYLYFSGKGYVKSRASLYMDKIIKFWEDIQASQDGRIVLKDRTCLFCFKTEEESKENKSIYRFLYCNHSYHPLCMYKWGLDTKQCCPCAFEPIEGELFSNVESRRPPFLDREDIKRILGFLLDSFRKENLYDYFVENSDKIQEFNKKYDVSLEDMCWVYQNKLAYYKQYRILFKMWKSLKLMCCVLAFYPSKLMNSKKGKLVRKLLNVRATGSTIRGFK